MDEDIQCLSLKDLEKKDDPQTSVDNNTDFDSEHENDYKSLKFVSPVIKSVDRRIERRNKFSKLIYYLIALVTIILLIAIVLAAGAKRASNESPVNFSRALVLIGNNDALWAFDPNSMKYHILHQLKMNIHAFDIYLNKTILWIEENATTIGSLSQEYRNIKYMEERSTNAIAIDYVTEKLYIVDKSAGTLNIIDMRYNYSTIVFSDLKDPQDIVLDTTYGLMFIAQLKQSIIRGNMDGTSKRVIIISNSISAITINFITSNVYWANAYESIESSDYEGENRVVWTQVSADILGLAIFDNQLFWLFPTHKYSNSVLFSCRVTNETCGSHSVFSIPFKSAMIKAFSYQYARLRQNPCEKENGKCEHFCLLTSNGRHSCACKIGWQLNLNLKNCSPITDVIFYVSGNLLRGKILNKTIEPFTDAIVPIQLFVEKLERKVAIDFEKGFDSHEIFYSDDTNIYKLNISNKNLTHVFKLEEGYYITGLATDWLSKNLYYFKISESVNEQSIEMISIKYGQVLKKTILSYNYDNPSGGFASQSLIVNPYESYIFYIVKSLTNVIKLISTVNSTDLVDYWAVTKFYGNYELLAIDYEENALYWIQEISWLTVYVYYASVFSGELENYKLYESIANPMYLTIHKQWLYIGDQSNIWRFDKKTGENALRIGIRSAVDANQNMFIMKILKLNTSSASEPENQCAKDNGGCEQFCFFEKSNRTCGCEDDSQIVENGRCTN